MNDCWYYAGAVDREDYGQLYVRIKGILYHYKAHRVVYENLVGEIPEGLVVDHLCRVHRCINPKHLETVTNRENLLRGNTLGGINARKTHCFNGHKFDKQNTYMQGNRRKCRKCGAKWSNDRYHRLAVN